MARQTREDVIGVVHFGLGPIGRSVAALTAQRPWLRSVAAVDVSDDLQGVQLSDLTEVQADADGSPAVGATLPAVDGAAVALHCTTSSLAQAGPQILQLVERGLNVVSTTEELSYPWDENPTMAKRIDEAAKEHGVTVLGTGINPGFAMDYLPVALSAAAHEVQSVVVHRVQDAGTRRAPLQRKVGAGMDVDTFRDRVEAGTLGHVGLRESVQAIGRVFGWPVEVTETIEPIVADQPTPMTGGVIAPGEVLGIHQMAQGRAGGVLRVELTLDMAVGIGPAKDQVRLVGTPELRCEVPGGFPGDTCTAAVVVNAVPRVVHAAPGLRTMSELPPPNPGRPGFGEA